MANFDMVFPYDHRLENWLRERGHPCPSVRPGNRFPTKDEVLAAISEFGTLDVERADQDEFDVMRRDPTARGCELRIGSRSWQTLGSDPSGMITMRGGVETAVTLLARLASICGQLVLYPDSGDPPAIVEPNANTARLVTALNGAAQAKDAWRYFFASAGYEHDGRRSS